MGDRLARTRERLIAQVDSLDTGEAKGPGCRQCWRLPANAGRRSARLAHGMQPLPPRGYLNEPSIGQCSVSTCGKQVCGPPPHRADGKVHGEHCSCLNGCGKLFCRPHAKGHLKAHGGSDGCFPILRSRPVGRSPQVRWPRWHASHAHPPETKTRIRDSDARLRSAAQQPDRRFLDDITPGVEDTRCGEPQRESVSSRSESSGRNHARPVSVDGPRIAPEWDSIPSRA